MVVTEKIDGTNAQICVYPDGTMLVGSRTRWITPEDDNFGFARWVKDNEEALRTQLGFGIHFGEWWGAGIQRRYGLTEKRFSLFNVSRWNSPMNLPTEVIDDTDTRCIEAPLCHVVPIIVRGQFNTTTVDRK